MWSLDGGQPRVPPEVVAELTSDAIRLGFERTLEQDVALGVRQLADIASKALSPAINDPYTAVQALDHLSVILSALAPTAARRSGAARDRRHRARDGAADAISATSSTSPAARSVATAPRSRG